MRGTARLERLLPECKKIGAGVLDPAPIFSINYKLSLSQTGITSIGRIGMLVL